MSLSPLSSTDRTRLRRYPERARTDRSELYAVLDAGLVGYVAAVVDGSPHVIPMVSGRVGDTLYLHGSAKNQVLSAAAAGAEVCVNVTDIGGLVLANTLYHHSVCFRSAVVYGSTRVVTDETERLAAFRATGEQLVPGRPETLRPPSGKELAGLTVLALSLAEASVKVREGGPFHEPDEDGDIWAGVLPVQQTFGTPLAAPETAQPTPEHVARLVGRAVGNRRG